MHESQHQQVHRHFPPYPQQRNPLLAVASGSNYSYIHPRSYRPRHDNGYALPVTVDVGNANGADGGMEGAYFDDTAFDDGGSYGIGYDYHAAHGPHVPTSGIYAHPAHTVYEPLSLPAFSRDKKQGASSTLTALTLLSFFFFLNLLHGCLRESMDAMNPTVMVMTAGMVRHKSNKFADINSREGIISPSSAPNIEAITSGTVIVLKAESILLPSSVPILLQSSYSHASSGTNSSANYNYHSEYRHNDKISNGQEINNNYDTNEKSNDSDMAEFYGIGPNYTTHSALSSEGHPHPAGQLQNKYNHHFAVNFEKDEDPRRASNAQNSNSKRTQSFWASRPDSRKYVEKGESLGEGDYYYEDQRY